MTATETPARAVIYTVEAGIATITLNRPERLNAWNNSLAVGLRDCLAAATADSDVGAVILTGAGRGFCAGADFEILDSVTSGAQIAGAEGYFLPTSALAVPKPIIAAINGACAGLGLVLALCCDIRFAVDGAKITSAFVRRGLIAEYGSAWLLPRLVGTANALDILLSGRVFLADEAQRMGLVNRVVAPGFLLETARQYARELVDYCGPSAIKTIKEQVHRSFAISLDAAVDESLQLMEESVRSDDAREGLASYLEKRPPRFKPLSTS